MKKQKKCYIYTHVSTAIQVDGYSLDAQKDKLRKYAEYQDMPIAEEFSDKGHSGKNIKGRPEFVRMMEKIESSEDGVEYVLVFKLSRFGRNAADVLNSLQIMQDYGVNLICVEDGMNVKEVTDYEIGSRDDGRTVKLVDSIHRNIWTYSDESTRSGC